MHADFLYFIITAFSILIIGTRRAPLEPLLSPPITGKQALLAPFMASALLFSMYLLLKYTPINISFFFNATTTLAGSLCLKEALDPITHSLLSLFNLQNRPIYPSTPDSPSPPPLPTLLSSFLALATTSVYLLHFPPTYLFSNILAIAISSRVIALIRPSSFVITAALLSGLLCYDIFWVFGSEVMVSVATQIDSPAKLMFPRQLLSQSTMQYPYSILGLGDVCVPGIFISLAQTMDRGIHNVKDGQEPYFSAALSAYVLGLAACFAVNLKTGAAQPALLYLVPALILSVLGMASYRGELNEVLRFKVKVGEEGGQS